MLVLTVFRMVVAGSSKATVPTSIKESQGRGQAADEGGSHWHTGEPAAGQPELSCSTTSMHVSQMGYRTGWARLHMPKHIKSGAEDTDIDL